MPLVLAQATEPAKPAEKHPAEKSSKPTDEKPPVKPAAEKPGEAHPAKSATTNPQPASGRQAVPARSAKQNTAGQASSGTPGQASSGTPGQASSGTPGQASSGTPGQASSGTPGQAGSGMSAAEKPAPAISRPAPPVSNPFVGGSRAELTFDFPVNYQTAENLVTAALRAKGLKPDDAPFNLTPPSGRYDKQASYTTWVLQIKLLPQKTDTVVTQLAKQLRSTPYFAGASTIGGAVAEGTRWQAAYALMASWLLIILYLWIRFQGVAFGLAAVIALIHDVLVMLGAIALSIYVAPYFGWLLIEPFKINLPIVAAFLTIIGYSVNDTIVVFDRIREVRGKAPRSPGK